MKLMDRVLATLRIKRYSARTENKARLNSGEAAPV